MTRRPSTQHPGPDRLLDLALELLPPRLREATLDHLVHCIGCDEQFQAIMASHVRAEAEKESVFAGGGPARLARAQARRVSPPHLLAAAAVLLVALGVVWTAGRHRVGVALPGAKLLPRLPAADLRGTIRSEGVTAADSVVLRGLDAYNRGDAREAERLLESARVSGRMADVRRIYLGSLRMQRGDAKGARGLLTGMQEVAIPEPWKSEARWTLALALAGTGDRAAADSLLDVLAAEQGPVAERAKAFLAARSGR